MFLELKRDFIAVPLLGMLGVMNGFLYLCLYWKINEYEIGADQAANSSYMKNLVGLCFMLVSDQIIEMSFGQIMIIPMVYPVYQREVSNNMYRPTPFFIARVLISALTFLLYPFMLTMTVIWFLGMPLLDFQSWCVFWGILSLVAFVGSALGLSIGAMLPNAFSALNVNQSVVIIFSFGAGLYSNTGTSANILVKFISWISPLHYSTELLLRQMLKDKNEEFSD